MARFGRETQILEKEKVKPPRMYKVLLHNDDYTTMDFVIYILQDVFDHPYEKAYQIMMDVHQKGAGLVGLYPKDIAAVRVKRVLELAEEAEFPLRATFEPE